MYLDTTGPFQTILSLKATEPYIRDSYKRRPLY